MIKIGRSNMIRIAITMLILIVIGNLVVLTFMPVSEFSVAVFLSNALYSLLIGGTMAIGISLIGGWLDRHHPWLKNPMKRLILQASLSIGYCLIVIFVVVVVLYVFFNRESDFLPALAESGLFMVKIAIGFLVLSMLITYTITFFINWRKSVVLQEQMKREQLALQYETLKNQVNPHFLFNSLNAVTSLISTDPDKAILFVKKLSEVLRYVLEQKDHELITLDDELQFLEAFIFLQKIRFGDNLTVNINVLDRNYYIVPLALQMLIENAIKHNVISKQFPLTIDISIKNENYLVVSNKLKRKPVLNSSHIGLDNIRSQYSFFSSDPVIVAESETEFRVELPLIKQKSVT